MLRDDKGTAAIEFAMVLPVFLLLMLGGASAFQCVAARHVLTMATSACAASGGTVIHNGGNSGDAIQSAKDTWDANAAAMFILGGTLTRGAVSATSTGVSCTASLSVTPIFPIGLSNPYEQTITVQS